jgi:hypothetical protein
MILFPALAMRGAANAAPGSWTEKLAHWQWE